MVRKGQGRHHYSCPGRLYESLGCTITTPRITCRTYSRQVNKGCTVKGDKGILSPPGREYHIQKTSEYQG
ncbi:hypothetical protein E2C01_052263 [Portunus trituberculatus]|uniref:Uncharacterized protein n=1 Tax=Portunus trituberculatus TaxID=210409 RepID=A0A5B7GM12_PORTR|nr:hypothetical protein [Portunus trituberculatus]